MSDNEMPETSQQDQCAVAAVRAGDTERYRELVERHERRVFAVAWSRLGDAALAEEVTQEAFIRAYRRLWLLGDGRKFSGWISTIARRVAVNFALSRRRELDRRKRWALENVSETAPEKSSAENEEPCSPETLRQTLAGLPAAHRECLVLFYLEDKSGAEAAAALGISESALRTRLHRARAALRERLEENLEGSLQKLRPAKTIVPAVMAGVLASSSAKAATAGGAGAGAKVLSALGKTFLFSWFFPLLVAVTNIPSLILIWFIGRKERQNFRDREGFRPKLHHAFLRTFMWGFPVLMIALLMLHESAAAAWGPRVTQSALAGFCVLMTLISGRTLVIARNAFQVSMFAYCAIIAVGLSVQALGGLPQSFTSLPLLAATIVFLFVLPKRPTRMDYSLFLRASQGLLEHRGTGNARPEKTDFSRRELLAFARFLGARFLVANYRWETNGLALRLAPVKQRFLSNMATVFSLPITRNCSCISLNRDGSASAHCGTTDLKDLAQISKASNAEELEMVVAESVSGAWREFRAGNLSTAGRILGDLPESELFVTPPSRALSTRIFQIFLGACVVLMALVVAMQFWHPSFLSGMTPINLSDAQVRKFMSLVNTNDNPLIPETIDGQKTFSQKGSEWDPFLPLSTLLLLPPTNLFTPQGIRAIHQTVLGTTNLEAWRQDPDRLQPFLFGQGHRAVSGGWLSWQDLNLQPADCKAFLHTNDYRIYEPKNWDRFLSRAEAWSWVMSKRWKVMRIENWGVKELRFLRDVDSLDLVNRRRLIQQIADVQTLSANPPGNPPIHDWKDVRGLFFTPCSPALQDTYFSLAALEILGGLNRIDREACIKGILRVHHGRGYFDSPNSGGYNEYHIDGSAEDTIAAYESLRILSALDRVKDLDQWQFRTDRRHLKNGQVTWFDIEAWVAQQRLKEIVKEQKKNPSAPYRSLLAP